VDAKTSLCNIQGHFKGGFTHQACPKEMLSLLTVRVGQNQLSFSCHMAVTFLPHGHHFPATWPSLDPTVEVLLSIWAPNSKLGCMKTLSRLH
jgi:hypothetical protein